MVMGYMCEQHGHQRECDVDDGGQRICTECGNAVTGVVGRARSTYYSPPEDQEMASGEIVWYVSRRGQDLSISAFDYSEAVRKAVKRTDNPQTIKEVKPKVARYRAR